MHILVCHSQEAAAQELMTAFRECNLPASAVHRGKDCQLKIFSESPQVLVIDVETKLHSAVEVIKYIRVNHLPTIVFLLFRDSAHADSLGMTSEVIQMMGVEDCVFLEQSAVAVAEKVLAFRKVRDILGDYESEPEIRAERLEMGIVTGDELLLGSRALMDYFTFSGEETYVRAFSRGQVFEDLPKQSLFFRLRDRSRYIEFMNKLLDSLEAKSELPSATKYTVISALAEHVIGHYYVEGINEKLVAEGRHLCATMYAFIETDPGLINVLKGTDKDHINHWRRLFLMAFFSSVIAKGLSWASNRTAEHVALAGFLQDIGLPLEFHGLTQTELAALPESAQRIYQDHPLVGANLLKEFVNMPQPVIQVVYQHHELVNGEGFPNKLSTNHIYPLAKIVSLAQAFVTHMLEHQLSPVETLSEFIKDRRNLVRFDSEAVRSLIKSFIK